MTNVTYTLLYFLPLFGLVLVIGLAEPVYLIVGKYLCSHGRHKFKRGYYCRRCKKEKGVPKLRILSGGVKDIKFPDIA